jgi:hypothetical protein
VEKRIITALSLYIDFRNLLRSKALTCQLHGNAQAVEVVIIVRKSRCGRSCHILGQKRWRPRGLSDSVTLTFEGPATRKTELCFGSWLLSL